MVDIDNVVKAIELCVSLISLSDITFNGEVEICPHSECPYFTTYGAGKCITAMCKDAADLLKAQEPRVMTLEEARNALHNEIVVWVEVKSDELYGLLCGVRMNGRSYFYMQNDDVLGVTDFDNIEYSAAYGKLIRLWTSQPTDAQMRETPWRIGDGNANG